MPGFTQTFGGNTLYPAEPDYLQLALAADTELQWPIEQQVGGDDGVAAGQRRDHREPRRVVTSQPVQQQQRRTGAGLDVRPLVAVDGEVLDLDRLRHAAPHGCSPVTVRRICHELCVAPVRR